MTVSPTHARICPDLPLREDDETEPADDEASDDEADDALEDSELSSVDGSDDDADDDAEDEAREAQNGAPRLSWRDRMRRRARGHGGMGRRSTGPAPRPSSAPLPEDAVSEAAKEPEVVAVPDITTWPGTSDAAKMVGRHVSTIKLWRAQGRIRAEQDASGCWRHHPDDLAESVDTPDATDAGSVLAQGMTAIVAQGASANERLLTMTEIATTGLQTAAGVLSTELERAYAKIADLEEKLSMANDKLAATRELDLKHERYMRRLDQKHELAVAGTHETSERLQGLLTIIGPIAASIAARALGNIMGAERIEARAAGAPSPTPISPGPSSTTASSPVATVEPPSDAAPPPPKDDRLVPLESRITDAMSRLCIAIRSLDGPAYQGFRAMMPPTVQAALDDVMAGTSDSAVGQALAVLIRAAQNLSDLQFKAIRPIAPVDIANVLSELRELIRVKEDQPS